MAHGNPQPNRASPESEKRGFEIHDASARGIVISAVCLVAAAAIIYVVAWWMMRSAVHGEDREASAAYPASPLIGSIPTRPPEPTLEPVPHHDVLPRADL